MDVDAIRNLGGQVMEGVSVTLLQVSCFAVRALWAELMRWVHTGAPPFGGCAAYATLEHISKSRGL